MWTILKKEFKTYFLSPIGYVVIGIFLFAFNVFFILTVLPTGSVDMGALYYYTALYGLMIIAPILTMRMFAEERKTGTEQLLLTSPRSISAIVFGKFLAAMAVIIITVLVSIMYFFIVKYFANPNFIVLLVQILGFILVSGAAISVGMFASSITENQIVAGVITSAFLIISLFMPQINDIFSSLTIMNFYQKFPGGLISLNEVISLIAFTGMFIALTIIVMKRRQTVK